MIIANGDGTAVAGMWDVFFIYENVQTGRFHPVVYVRDDPPGGGPVSVVRLKSKMSHPEGFATFQEAVDEVAAGRQDLVFDDLNVYIETAVPWDGMIGDVMIVPDWRQPGAEKAFVPSM